MYRLIYFFAALLFVLIFMGAQCDYTVQLPPACEDDEATLAICEVYDQCTQQPLTPEVFKLDGDDLTPRYEVEGSYTYPCYIPGQDYLLTIELEGYRGFSATPFANNGVLFNIGLRPKTGCAGPPPKTDPFQQLADCTNDGYLQGDTLYVAGYECCNNPERWDEMYPGETIPPVLDAACGR